MADHLQTQMPGPVEDRAFLRAALYRFPTLRFSTSQSVI